MNTSLIALAFAGSIVATTASAATTFIHSQIYAHIFKDGTIVGISKGVAAVLHPETGTYCIQPISATLKTAVSQHNLVPNLTLDWINTSSPAVFLGTAASLGCPDSTYISVNVSSVAGSSPVAARPVDATFAISFQ